jgi:hypothetical protein
LSRRRATLLTIKKRKRFLVLSVRLPLCLRDYLPLWLHRENEEARSLRHTSFIFNSEPTLTNQVNVVLGPVIGLVTPQSANILVEVHPKKVLIQHIDCWIGRRTRGRGLGMCLSLLRLSKQKSKKKLYCRFHLRRLVSHFYCIRIRRLDCPFTIAATHHNTPSLNGSSRNTTWLTTQPSTGPPPPPLTNTIDTG